MRLISIWLALGLALGLAACQRAASPPENIQAAEIEWREGDVDDALAEAKESGKPVMLYWGAKWCPPCNQMKSTLFKDAGFVAETRNFVPVYLDGDSEGAQRWGERFGISGYPTVIILRADGSEITRLSSATTVSQLPEILRVAATRTTPIETLFAAAAKNPAALTNDEWRLLAAFDWQNDPRHFSDPAHAGALLDRLAAAAPDGALERRFTLLALTVGARKGSDGRYRLDQIQQTRLLKVLPAILSNSEEVTANRLELSYSIPPLLAALPDARKRGALGASLVTALDRVYGDEALPIPDRLGTVSADIALAKAEGGPIPPAVREKVRVRAGWADKAATDPMVRQSVISSAAALLHEVGDAAGAKRLLEAELKRSASPYYYMLDLAGIAEEEGDGPAAIGWARKAYETAQGSATRVQWAIEYSKTVLRQAPDDKAAVEASAAAVIDELGKNPGSYYQRTRAKVSAWGSLIRQWSEAHDGAAALGRLDARMADVCAQQGEEAADCRRWAKAA